MGSLLLTCGAQAGPHGKRAHGGERAGGRVRVACEDGGTVICRKQSGLGESSAVGPSPGGRAAVSGRPEGPDAGGQRGRGNGSQFE